MKRFYLLAILLVGLGSCTEDNSIILESSQSSEMNVGVQTDSVFVSADKALHIAEIFVKRKFPMKGSQTTRTKSELTDLSGFAGDIDTVFTEKKTPLMYVVNFAEGGFVIVGASKDYYPILGYSDKNTLKVKDVLKSGFSVWVDEIDYVVTHASSLDIEERKQINNQWISSEDEISNVAPLDATDDHYLNGTLFRQRLAELYAMYPNYSFGPLSSWQYQLSNYDYLVSRAEIYGSPLEFTIIGYKYDSSCYGPLTNTKWHQGSPFNALCKGDYTGCAPLAMAHIMKYHKWPVNYDWNSVDAVSATPTTQQLIYDLGVAAGIRYGFGDTGATESEIIGALKSMKYDVTAKKSQVDGVEQQIMNGRPILMLGYDQSNSSGHAWVCDGFKHHGTNMNYFIEYRTPNSSTYTYSTCGESSPDMPYSHRVSGSTEYYMKWGWNGSGDGWYIASNVSVNGYNFSHNRKDLYITPKR